ncbi:MAG: hypothetical protein V4693_14775 [Pseudomonadota bacterium]
MTLQSQPRAARRFAGRVVVAAVICGGGFSALAAHAEPTPAPGAQTYDIAMMFTTPTTKAAPRLRVRATEQFKVQFDDKGKKMTAAFVLTPVGTKEVRLEGTVECGNRTPARPILLTHLGATATVKVQETGTPGCELAMVVTQAAMGVPAR